MFNLEHCVPVRSLLSFAITHNTIKGELSDSFNNYNNVGNTKVRVSIKKNLCQQMHIERDISN